MNAVNILEYSKSFYQTLYQTQTLLSKMSVYYSRETTIELLIQSLYRMRDLCEGSNHLELSDAFVIRIKTMAHLAQLAFTYSLKVSYLEEQREYAPMADLLDDVYLQLPRKNLRYVPFMYRNIVSVEHDKMRASIDLMDERLKTIRVVVLNRYRRRTPTKQYATKTTTNVPVKSQCWVDSNGYRVRTQPGLTSASKSIPLPDPETPISKRNRTLVALNTDLDIDSVAAPVPAVPTVPTPTVRVPTPTFSSQVRIFKKAIQMCLVYLDNTNTKGTQEYALNRVDKLVGQCEHIIKITDNVMNNLDLFERCEAFRSKSPYTKSSFMQTVIYKFNQLIDEVNDHYDYIRNLQLRADPNLRKIKNVCIQELHTAQDALCKVYESSPYEIESLRDVIEGTYRRHDDSLYYAL